MSDRIDAVLAALDTTAPQEIAALDICRSANLPSGVAGSTLRRMVELGWVVGRWETSAPRLGHARRQVYKLTAEGGRRARQHGRASVVAHNERKGSHHE